MPKSKYVVVWDNPQTGQRGLDFTCDHLLWAENLFEKLFDEGMANVRLHIQED